MFSALAIVLAHAQVMTMSPDAKRQSASNIAIVGDQIVYVGDDFAAAKKAAGQGAEVIDMQNRFVMPGFNDAHVHFGLAITLGSPHGVDIPSLPLAKFMAALRRESAARPGSDWLFVATRQMPSKLSSKRDLDRLNRPVFVISERGGLLNKRALDAIGANYDELPDGFVRGRVLASMLARAAQHLPPALLEREAKQFVRMLAQAGITSVQLIDEVPEVFEKLRAAGQLDVRVRFVPIGYRLDTFRYASTWKGAAPDWVRVDGLKYFHDDWARLGRYELAEIADEAKKTRHPIVVHVLSRLALKSLLDGIEVHTKATPEDAQLFRLDHVDEITPELAARIAKLGIVVCSNPSMIPEWHTNRAFPMKTLLAQGVRTCIGTDYVGRHEPARPLAPLANVALAVTHGGYGTEERISVTEALEAYTVGSAAAENMSARKGTLTEGKLADLVVLSEDPRKVAEDHLADLQILMTMVGGRIVHRAPGFAEPVRGPSPPSIGLPPQSTPPTIGPAKGTRSGSSNN